MTKSIVEIETYDPSWENQFEREKQGIEEVLGQYAVMIEHIGSTSVRGLAAKPIIDIMVGTVDIEDAALFTGPLCEIGYEYVPKPAFESKGRFFFRKGVWGKGTCHLHVCKWNGSEWRDKLMFRDYLRAHPEAAAEYASLKRQLAIKHKDERSAYTKEKEPFIQAILLKVRDLRRPNMFVKIYEYHIQKEKEALFLDIQDKVRALYQEYVSCDVMLLKSLDDETKWVEVSKYDNEDAYQNDIQIINKERAVQALFKAFEGCLVADKAEISEQNYIRMS